MSRLARRRRRSRDGIGLTIYIGSLGLWERCNSHHSSPERFLGRSANLSTATAHGWRGLLLDAHTEARQRARASPPRGTSLTNSNGFEPTDRPANGDAHHACVRRPALHRRGRQGGEGLYGVSVPPPSFQKNLLSHTLFLHSRSPRVNPNGVCLSMRGVAAMSTSSRKSRADATYVSRVFPH